MVENYLLPGVDHTRMHAVLGRQLQDGALALCGFRRRMSQKIRIMVPAFRHALISFSWDANRRHILVSVTVRFSGGTSVGQQICFISQGQR